MRFLKFAAKVRVGAGMTKNGNLISNILSNIFWSNSRPEHNHINV